MRLSPSLNRSKKVGQLDIGWVVVKRNNGGEPFSVLVSLMQNIHVGSTVKLVKVSYYRDTSIMIQFLAIR